MSEKQHFDSKYFDDIDNITEEGNYFVPVLRELSQTCKTRGKRYTRRRMRHGPFHFPPG
jgi:uncharacterized protein YlaI